MENGAADVRSVGIGILATLGLVAALYLGGEFLAPIAFAMVLAVLCRPVVRTLKRIGMPATLAAAVVVLGIMALVAGAGYALATPARAWMQHVPTDFEAASARLEKIRAPMKRISDAADKVTRVAQGPATRTPASAPAAEQHVQADVAATPPGGTPNQLLSRLAGSSTQVVGGAVEVLLLLYLILAADGLFLRKLGHIARTPAHGETAAAVMHDAEAVVLRYVVVTALINLGQSVVIALAMWKLGLPAPLLWGVFTFVLEFVPYLGALAMIALLGATALATFDSIGHILAVPGTYLLVSGLQNNLVSPLAYGRGLKLNPVAVLIGVLFWWYLWGIPGAFLAVPILAMMRVAGDHIRSLRAVCELLSD